MNQDPGLASWLQLTLTPGIGAAALRDMLRKFGLPQNVIARKPSELAAHIAPEALKSMTSAQVRDAVSRALDWAAGPGHFIVTLADAAYPRALLEIPDPPTLLYATGRPEFLQCPSLAIVGSRNATAQGESNAESFAKTFSTRRKLRPPWPT